MLADPSTNSVLASTKVSLLEAERVGFERPEVVEEWAAVNAGADADKKVRGGYTLCNTRALHLCAVISASVCATWPLTNSQAQLIHFFNSMGPSASGGTGNREGCCCCEPLHLSLRQRCSVQGLRWWGLRVGQRTRGRAAGGDALHGSSQVGGGNGAWLLFPCSHAAQLLADTPVSGSDYLTGLASLTCNSLLCATPMWAVTAWSLCALWWRR